MGRVVKSIFGGQKVSRPAPIQAAPEPDPEPVSELEEDKEKTRKQRARLFKTEGGAAGQEVLSGGVSQRNTLLGN